MRINWMKLTATGFGAAAFAAALALALPAQADEKLSQMDFVDDCNATDPGVVIVPAGTEMEVENPDGGLGTITVDCTVTLGADSELQFGETTNLLFFCDAVCDEAGGTAGFKDFTIESSAGKEIELQVKKNSVIEAGDFTVMVVGAEEAEAQFEENFCLVLEGDLTLSMSTGSDEGGDIQFKKRDDPFDTDSTKASIFAGTPCAPVDLNAEATPEDPTDDTPSPNIDVGGNILMGVTGDDSEIQIEESNDIFAGGFFTLLGLGGGSQVQTKKEVKIKAEGDFEGVGILLTAPDDKGEVQVEEDNDFDATGGDIEISSGDDGKTEVKILSVFTASDDITVESDGECKIEADTGTWSSAPMGGCDETFTP